MDLQRESCYLLLAAGREEGPLICAVAALGRLIWWCRYRWEAKERKCKTNSVGFSGLPADLGGPIYTDPLPPNVPSSGQKRKTDATRVCLCILCYPGGLEVVYFQIGSRAKDPACNPPYGCHKNPGLFPRKLFHLSGIFFPHKDLCFFPHFISVVFFFVFF